MRKTNVLSLAIFSAYSKNAKRSCLECQCLDANSLSSHSTTVVSYHTVLITISINNSPPPFNPPPPLRSWRRHFIAANKSGYRLLVIQSHARAHAHIGLSVVNSPARRIRRLLWRESVYRRKFLPEVELGGDIIRT